MVYRWLDAVDMVSIVNRSDSCVRRQRKTSISYHMHSNRWPAPCTMRQFSDLNRWLHCIYAKLAHLMSLVYLTCLQWHSYCQSTQPIPRQCLMFNNFVRRTLNLMTQFGNQIKTKLNSTPVTESKQKENKTKNKTEKCWHVTGSLDNW